ncbi:5'-methylthioadenosine/S-adenosylhomocysteine nucleosidase [Thiospirochaeta perfilievii]|uniref:5'-methylthioadenosine/S-adenosylhomocysteine nucleosidase n=1 Tax=Thiospirochaeta perfilievii TaxID=252967 RepID=A0A5C1QBK0_9SPIO|nr:5'-methylthioadenosine/S-adenosylhomocysteine nucleosidase [Thiospirochaeta perfilievii]QEN04044.1 5'-methylthioadenosine/S-adenosylhomocysteine nucleosidase [Thiospirochaeta perfilievii]
MRIGLIGAMEEEVNGFLHKMKDVKTIEKCGTKLYHGTLFNTDVVLLQCGIGKVAAAVGTTILIDQFSPDLVINTGSAGGLSTDLNVGDVIISQEVRYHDVDVTLFGYEYGQIPKMPPGFTPDKKLIEVAKKAAKKIDKIHVTDGLIITGDSFIHDEDDVDRIKSKLPPMKATEMEAAAIAQVCHMSKVPFLIIRSISDVPGKESKQSFEEFLVVAAKNSGMLIEEIILELKEK